MHMMKVNEPGYMKKVMAFSATQGTQETPDSEGTAAQREEQEQEKTTQRTATSSTPGGSKQHRRGTPTRVPYLTTAQ